MSMRVFFPSFWFVVGRLSLPGIFHVDCVYHIIHVTRVILTCLLIRCKPPFSIYNKLILMDSTIERNYYSELIVWFFHFKSLLPIRKTTNQFNPIAIKTPSKGYMYLVGVSGNSLIAMIWGCVTITSCTTLSVRANFHLICTRNGQLRFTAVLPRSSSRFIANLLEEINIWLSVRSGLIHLF